jgi:uncharacterized membrane protein YbhN (UPF0104 family)
MALALAFIAWRIWKMGLDWSYVLQGRIIAGIFGLALVYMAMIYISAMAWKMVLQIWTVSKVPYSDASGVYVKANLGKYLPGNVMHFVERNLFGKRLGLSQLELALSSVFEIIIIIFVCAVFCLPIIGKTLLEWARQRDFVIQWWWFWIAGAVLAAVVVLFILLFRTKKSAVLRFARLTKQKKFWINGAKALLLYAVSAIMPSLTVVVIINWMEPVALAQIPMIMAVYLGSWLVGYVTPGAPGGLGVRESILLFGFGTMFTAQTILMSVVLQRLVSIIGDILAWLFFVILAKIVLQNRAK